MKRIDGPDRTQNLFSHHGVLGPLQHIESVFKSEKILNPKPLNPETLNPKP